MAEPKPVRVIRTTAPMGSCPACGLPMEADAEVAVFVPDDATVSTGDGVTVANVNAWSVVRSLVLNHTCPISETSRPVKVDRDPEGDGILRCSHGMPISHRAGPDEPTFVMCGAPTTDTEHKSHA